MLPLEERLRANTQFQTVYQQGTSFADGAVVLYCLRLEDPNLRQAGFSVSKKVGGAVVRNAVKRRMREAYRGLLPRLPRGIALVFVARRSAAEADYGKIEKSVQGALTKAALLQDVV